MAKDPRDWQDVLNAAGRMVADEQAPRVILTVFRLARLRGYSPQAAAQVLVSIYATGRHVSQDTVYWAKAIEIQQERLFGKARTHNRLRRDT